MANLYWSGPKAEKKEVIEALKKELVECTDGAFDARIEGDGAGVHAAIYVERDPNGHFEWKKEIPQKFMGWRIVKIFVPFDYVGAILQTRES